MMTLQAVDAKERVCGVKVSLQCRRDAVTFVCLQVNVRRTRSSGYVLLCAN